MRALVAMLCILGLMSNALAEAAENIGPYESDGSNSVEIVSLSVPSPNGAFTTTAYIPSGAGPFPVVIFSPGFFQKGIAYAPYAKRLGSWGIVTLLRDDPNFFADESHSDDLSRPDTVKTGAMADHMALDVAYEVMTWLPATNADPGSALYGKVDTKCVGLAGHSSGARIALVVGEALPGLIKGVFGLDPVDLSARAPARPKLASIGIPVAFIGETTNRFSCAPGWFNYQAVYRAAGSPAVAITAINADHAMFEDPANCSRCWLCKPAGTADASKVLAYSVRYLTAFFARELLGDVSVGSAFEGAGATADVNAGLIEISSK
jgi:dienelactone hydrolase